MTLLLDTCAVIYLFDGRPMQIGAENAIRAALATGDAAVSPVTAWEIGLLSRSGRRGAIAFKPDPISYVRNIMATAGISEAPLTSDIAVTASHLPGPLHDDPADRLLIATARATGIPIVTRDVRIIAYANAGNLDVIVC